MSDSTQPHPSPAVLAAYAAVEDLLHFKPVHTGRFGGWTPAQQRKFIGALAVTGTVERSCRAIGMSVQGAYKLRKRPDAAEFALAWDAAVARGRDRIYERAVDRAMNGYSRPRYHLGRQVGTIHAYDNRMAMHALNPPRPPSPRPASSPQSSPHRAPPSEIPPPPTKLSELEAYMDKWGHQAAFERILASLKDAPATG